MSMYVQLLCNASTSQQPSWILVAALLPNAIPPPRQEDRYCRLRPLAITSPHLQNYHRIQPNRKKHSWTISNTAKCLLHSHWRHQKLSSHIPVIEIGISIVQLYTMIIIIKILNLFFHHHQVLICLIPRCFLPPRWFRANKALYSRLTGATTVESIIPIAWY